MRRKLLIIGAIVLGVIIVAAVVVKLSLNSIAKAAVERGGTYALGVGTRVDSVSVKLLRGHISMDNLTVDNPKGYQDALLMTSGRWDVDVKTRSLFSDTVRVPGITLDGLNINIERRSGGNNISDVIAHITSLGGEKKSAGGKKLVIDSIVVRNIVAHVRPEDLTVRVPIVTLTNIGTESSGGVVMHDIVAQIFPAVIAAIVEKGKGILPVDLANRLGSDVVDAAKALGGGAAKVIGQVGGDLGKTAGDIGKAAGDVGKGLDKGLKDTGKGVGDAIDNLLGKKKDTGQ